MYSPKCLTSPSYAYLVKVLVSLEAEERGRVRDVATRLRKRDQEQSRHQGLHAPAIGLGKRVSIDEVLAV